MSNKQSTLFSAIAYSYIHYIDDYLAVLSNPSYTTVKYIDEATYTILSESKTLFLSLPSLLGGDSEYKEIYANKVVAFRNQLEDKYRSLHGLQRQLHHLSSLYNIKNALNTSSYEDFGMTEEDAIQMDFSMLAQDCTSYVFATQDKNERHSRAASLLTYIPMRMTKDSFLSYVEKALSRVDLEDTQESYELFLSILRQQFDGRLYNGYTTNYQDIRTSIEELENTSDPEEFFEQADLINEMLEHAMSLVGRLYHMLCVFGNLLIFDGLTFDTLTDMHVSFYDLFCSLQSVLEDSDDKEVLLETLPERVQSIKEQLETLYEKSLQSKDIDPLVTLINSYLYMSIHQVFGFTTTTHASSNTEVKKYLQDFLLELRERLDVLPPGERKLRMQYFMSVVPFIMNDTTFNDYIHHGFKGVTSPKRNLFTAMYLSNVLEQGGFFELMEQHDNLIPHTEKNCGCGHHHGQHEHSHHSCGCSHDDPNHTCSCNHDH